MTDPRPHVRPAVADDAAFILAMIRELARFEKAEDQVRATEADLRRDGWGPQPRFEALIGERDGMAEGFALFYPTYSTWEGRAGLFLEDLYVRPGARGSGLGQALVAAVAALAVERGCPRLELNVLDWNPARDFYRRLGIEHLTEWLPYRVAGASLTALAARAASGPDS
ncbi:MAG: N-acetyltransferase family protein [Inquilinaceae bacterium]